MIRLWLLALLVLTAGIAGGVLLVKFQLELLRTSVHAEIEKRTGILLNVSDLQVHGLTGLRLEELHMAMKTESGPAVDISVPRAYLFVSLLELLRGSVALDRLQLDRARIRLSRSPESDWVTSEVTERSSLAGNMPFRIVGQDCILEVEGIVGSSAFTVERLNFDLNRLSDSPHIIATLDGSLKKAQASDFTVFARYASLEDFDVRIQSEGLTAGDVGTFFPTLNDIVASGSARPSIRISGYPRDAMVVSLELPFRDIALKTEQRFPIPAEGMLTALASYDKNTRVLALSSAKTRAEGFEGRVEGTISLAELLPEFDLKLEVQQLPVNDVLAYAMDRWLDEYGSLTVDAPEPYKFFVTLSGTTESARLGVEAQMGNGTLKFEPALDSLPSADLQFSLMSVAWDSESSYPRGSLALSGGTIRHAPARLHAENISGTMTLDQDGLAFEPLVAQIAGNTILGSARYNMAEKALTFDVSGSLGAVEELDFVKRSPNLRLYGPVKIDALAGKITTGRIELDADLDLTRTDIGWEWWLSKAPGIGARMEALQVDIKPRKSALIACDASLDTITIATEIKLSHAGGKWALDEATARSENVSMGTANKVLNIPYAISGGTGTNAHLSWKRASRSPEVIELAIGGSIDDLTMVPAGLKQPITGKNVAVETLIRKNGDERTGTLDLHVASADLPPMGTPWLLPLRAEDDPTLEQFPPLNRAWTYNLSAGHLNYPPWQGTEFTGKGFDDEHKSGFETFQAAVEGGTVGGTYQSTDPANERNLNAHWEKVPAHFLLDHLKLPPIFTGTMTGGIEYGVDSDDRGTLKGTGFFDVVDGQFSADYLARQFEQQIAEAAISLPPSMKFSRFSADVVLDGDVVKTSNMALESPALKIYGEGQFIVDGDIDYHLRMDLPPATAKGIPALRTYFNLDGMKHSQSELKLAFHIYGPRFSPKMELDGMPSVGDTILSGAVEVTTDVMKVVDLPRQILLDLFKIGGGIVGAGGKKSPDE